jgi:hypothetical protein
MYDEKETFIEEDTEEQTETDESKLQMETDKFTAMTRQANNYNSR